MKTLMKKIAIAIVMIIAFYGSVSAQQKIYAAHYQVSYLGQNGWIVDSTLSYNHQASRKNYRSINLAAIGGDTVYARVVDSTGTVVHVNYWIQGTEHVLDTIYSDTISSNIISFVVANNHTVTNGCSLKPIFDDGEIPENPINRKFYIEPAVIDSANVGGKSVNSKTLKLSDFNIVASEQYGGYTASYDTIQWYRNDTLFYSGLDTMYTTNLSGEYSVKISVLFKTKYYVDPTLTIYGDHTRWFESNKLMINITSSSIVTFNVVGGNGTLNATVDGITIASNETVADNRDVVFTAIPATNYTIKKWMVNDTIVVGNTTNNFTLNSLSNNVTITVEFELVDGICEEIKNNIIRIYPNPTQNTITIEQPFFENTMISIFDITGQMVLQKKMESPVQQIDISGFPNGSYFIQVKSNNKTEFGKIIKL